eukprot:1159796-Pelagomonas_calceolata.AAC.5
MAFLSMLSSFLLNQSGDRMPCSTQEGMVRFASAAEHKLTLRKLNSINRWDSIYCRWGSVYCSWGGPAPIDGAEITEDIEAGGLHSKRLTTSHFYILTCAGKGEPAPADGAACCAGSLRRSLKGNLGESLRFAGKSNCATLVAMLTIQL